MVLRGVGATDAQEPAARHLLILWTDVFVTAHPGARHAVPQVLDSFRRYAKLRERLIPYLAEETKAGLAENKPLMRGLFFDHTDDPKIWDHQDHFRLGSALLVAPVTEPGATCRTVYLPVGTDWVDAWTGETVAGGQEILREAPLGTVPVFVTAGRWPTLKPLFSELV
ncbi:TIM-barrel domain-containing protein [Streptomyces sp. NBC_00893]|uniref:TIM-barrel domain-containing protein n=1 Tax=Streptomyces sp. NBC_00893 TaxID=2975862 RepID=UPI002257B2A7|nr:TIM-barrel domain-containing protein [Streptomyces sp. NBC_00893]